MLINYLVQLFSSNLASFKWLSALSDWFDLFRVSTPSVMSLTRFFTRTDLRVNDWRIPWANAVWTCFHSSEKRRRPRLRLYTFYLDYWRCYLTTRPFLDRTALYRVARERCAKTRVLRQRQRSMKHFAQCFAPPKLGKPRWCPAVCVTWLFFSRDTWQWDRF